MRWDPAAGEALRAAADAIPAAPGEGRVVQVPGGAIVGADDVGLALLHHSWDSLTGVSSLDPRWQSCGADGNEIPGEQHPAMVALATEQPVRGFVMGVDAPGDDGLGTFVWLEIDSDPLLDGSGTLLGAVTRFRDVSETGIGRRATQRVIRAYRGSARDAAAQHERFRAMVESSSDVILEAGRDGLITWTSSSVQDVLGWEPGELVGTGLLDLVHQLDRESAAQRGRALLEEQEAGGRDELRIRTSEGGILWMSAVWRMMTGPHGEEYGVLVSLRDVHADVERREALAHMAHHDGLTGLLNRDSAYAWMRGELASAHAAGRHLGVLYLDVDRFKQVNDTHGHGVGDEVLVAVGGALTASVRDEDMVARAGGDEFVVALRNIPGEQAVERRAEAILEAVRLIDVAEAGAVSLSIGLAVDDGTSDVDTIVERADAALFRAKRAGRDRWSW